MAKETKTKVKSKKFKLFPLSWLPVLLFIILLILLITTFEVTFSDKFFPRSFVGDTHLILLNSSQAYQVLNGTFQQRSAAKFPFTYKNQTFVIDLATASASINTSQAINEAFAKGHQGTIYQNLRDQLQIFMFGSNTSPTVSLSLSPQENKIAEAIYIAPKDAKLSVEENPSTSSSNFKVSPSQNGLELDKLTLYKSLTDYIIFGQIPPTLPTKKAPPKITTEKADLAKKYLENTNLEPIKLTFEDQTWTIDTKALLTLINLEGAQSELLDKDKLVAYLKGLSDKINQPVKEGQFAFDPNSKKVSAFTPSQEGRELDIPSSATLITLALVGERAKIITLPVKITEPKIKTGQVNDLGINELIGRGISNFAESIPNRAYNVSLTASKINGVLIPPGEIFSFVQTVGDPTAEAGFKQAYVIKSGRTVLDDGGGVCQDSTTLFRAVLNAGLPVVERTAHAYRVGYYEQGFPPGLDATVFYPSVDFKFKNDTTFHILIQAYTEGLTLYVDLYGTSDGRVAILSTPIVSNQTPPPPELRQDDPTLPRGTVKQVDFAAWGADVSFKRNVTRSGETLTQETWRSAYKPWQAIYLVGTQ